MSELTRLTLNRGSYLSACVLLEERDNKGGLLRILSLFCNTFNEINKTGAQMLDCIYHYSRPLVKNAYPKNIFIISEPKHMRLVFKRTDRLNERFFWAFKTYVKTDN